MNNIPDEEKKYYTDKEKYEEAVKLFNNGKGTEIAE
jgi:hypothetical protein